MGQWTETDATSNVHFNRVLVAQQGHLSCILKEKKFVNDCVCLEGHQAKFHGLHIIQIFYLNTKT